MINKQTLEYYDWEDVQTFLCEKLGINDEHFRDYHFATVHKGMSEEEYYGINHENFEYRDWWHIWLAINYDDVSNGAYNCVWFEMIIDNLKSEEFRKKHQYGEWITDLVGPLQELEKEVGSDHIYIHYWW